MTIVDNPKVSRRSDKDEDPKEKGFLNRPRVGGKSYWEWLDLLAKLAIPLVLGIATILFNSQQADLAQKQHVHDQNIANQQHDADQQRAQDQQRQTTLVTYLDNMNNLLNRGLLTSKSGDEIRVIARTETLSAMRQLDGRRNSFLVQFLQDAGLIGQSPKPNISLAEAHIPSIIDFSRADMSGIDLSGANLSYASLNGANLTGANLAEADLSEAGLTGVNFSHAILRDASLVRASLSGALLDPADLTGANLYEADLSCGDRGCTDLSGANLSGASLDPANLRGAKLDHANFSHAILRDANLSCYCDDPVRSKVTTDLTGANLYEADLSCEIECTDLRGANLRGANLRGANLRGANLSCYFMQVGSAIQSVGIGANLSSLVGVSGKDYCANLKDAKVTDEQLAKAKSLQGATMPDGSINQCKSLCSG
jgi:uncharacterized protein YjbI with pentapeptide repeats